MWKFLTRHYRKINLIKIQMAGGILVLAALFLPSYIKWEEPGNTLFHIFLNGEKVGSVTDVAYAEELLKQSRVELVQDSAELIFIDTDMSIQGETVYFGQADEDEAIKANMTRVLSANIKETTKRSYVVKVNNYMVNLGSIGDVEELLQAAVNKYDTEGRYQVNLAQDTTREFNVLTADIVDTQAEDASGVGTLEMPAYTGGFEKTADDIIAAAEPTGEKDFSDYELGIKSMGFSEEVEIVEVYLDSAQLSTVEAAIEEVIKEQEVNSIYVVESGDTLSEIAIKTDIPMDQLVAMNDALEDTNSTIRIGQELIITIPEPELSVVREEERYYEEIYDAPIQYVYNDNWYTNQTKTLQEPSAGFRKAVARVSFINDEEISREILKEELVMEAVPKIVEKGTKIPPTYIKPISGGRKSSGFGRRSAPVKGASTYHKGIDWAVPKGTRVNASCGGKVIKAGWGSGYGYVVYIEHEDGRQTRYAHLSKVLVSVGQRVSQGDKIALSGNTGVSSGPHLHFEILINGKQVNPEKYLD